MTDLNREETGQLVLFISNGFQGNNPEKFEANQSTACLSGQMTGLGDMREKQPVLFEIDVEKIKENQRREELAVKHGKKEEDVEMTVIDEDDTAVNTASDNQTDTDDEGQDPPRPLQNRLLGKSYRAEVSASRTVSSNLGCRPTDSTHPEQEDRSFIKHARRAGMTAGGIS
ncbi:MAG: hypothetical protein Q9166_002549 [cf. Caloplaca sp. 2 TL-2023]